MATSHRSIHRINLAGGEKGGTGKTTLSRCMAQYFIEQNIPFNLIEADAQINDVGRVYGADATEAATITLSDDRRKATNPDVIFELALKANVLVNLPSNTLDVMDRWIKRTRLLALLEQDYKDQIRLYQWFVSDGCYESIRQLHKSIQSHHYKIPHIVVLNEGRLNGDDFSYLESSPLFQEVKQCPNLVKVVTFPALESPVQYYIDEHELTIGQTLLKIQSAQGLMAKQRMKTFVDEFTAAFDACFKALDALEGRSNNGSSNSKGPKVKPVPDDSPKPSEAAKVVTSKE